MQFSWASYCSSFLFSSTSCSQTSTLYEEFYRLGISDPALSLRYSLNVRDKFSHSYKTTDKIIFLYILVNIFGTDWQQVISKCYLVQKLLSNKFFRFSLFCLYNSVGLGTLFFLLQPLFAFECTFMLYSPVLQPTSTHLNHNLKNEWENDPVDREHGIWLNYNGNLSTALVYN
jgi:hypothetical protein